MNVGERIECPWEMSLWKSPENQLEKVVRCGVRFGCLRRMGYFTASPDFYVFGEIAAGIRQAGNGVTYCHEITYNTMRNRDRLQDFTGGWSETRRLVKLDRDVPNETGMDIGCPNEGSPVTRNKDLRRFLPAVRRRAAKAAVGN